jgi:hypothetical protein
VAGRKARKSAPGRSDAGSTGLAKAGELKWPEATFFPHSCLAVYDGQTCIVFLLSRGKLGHEAFDRDENSLGIFPSMKLAAAAVSEAVS